MKPTNLRLHSSASRLTSRACGQMQDTFIVCPSHQPLQTSLREEPSQESRLQVPQEVEPLCMCVMVLAEKRPSPLRREMSALRGERKGRCQVGSS